MPLKTFEHVLILANDLEKTKNFYVNLLGLTSGYRPDFPFSGLWLYLNDNDGGETTFADYNIRVKPEAGKALMFPPLWTYQHTGEKPKNKPKYIVGTYLHYV